MAFAALRRHKVAAGGWHRVGSALLTEVSLLPPAVLPAEPLAQVVLLRELPAAVGATSYVPAAAGEQVILGGPVLRRPIRQVLGVR